MANRVRVDDWTTELAIIASNVYSVHVDDWTAELAIIASNVYLNFILTSIIHVRSINNSAHFLFSNTRISQFVRVVCSHL